MWAFGSYRAMSVCLSVCVCVRPRGCGLWLLRFTFRMGIGTDVAGSRLKRFMRLLVIIYGLHICVLFVVIAVVIVVVVARVIEIC